MPHDVGVAAQAEAERFWGRYALWQEAVIAYLSTMKANAQFSEEQSDGGEFQRQEDAFRAWVTDDGSSPHPVARGRYHL